MAKLELLQPYIATSQFILLTQVSYTTLVSVYDVNFKC